MFSWTFSKFFHCLPSCHHTSGVCSRHSLASNCHISLCSHPSLHSLWSYSQVYILIYNPALELFHPAYLSYSSSSNIELQKRCLGLAICQFLQVNFQCFCVCPAIISANLTSNIFSCRWILKCWRTEKDLSASRDPTGDTHPTITSFWMAPEAALQPKANHNKLLDGT